MRIISLIIVLVLMGSVAQAKIVNGEFEDSGLNPTYSSAIDNYDQLDEGWYTNRATQATMEISGGKATRFAETGGTTGGMGQFFTESQTGSLALEFDVTIKDANRNLKFYVRLYGYNQAGAGTAIRKKDNFYLQTKLTIVTPEGDNYDITELAAFSHENAGSVSGRQSLHFTGSSDYEFYAVRFVSNLPNKASDRVTIDNVEIVSVATK